MRCPACSATTIRWGKDRNGHQRYRCRACGRTVTDVPENPIAPMRIRFERAVLCLSLLSEGTSVRATERVTGTHRDTICRLLVLAGGKCERLLAEMLRSVEAEGVQVATLRAFIGMAETPGEAKGRREADLGVYHTSLAQDPSSKVILAHHTGRRTSSDKESLLAGLDRPTGSASLVSDPGPDRPPRCTQPVERLCLDLRTRCRRFARGTNGFSRKLENHRAAVAVFAAVHNFVEMHSSLRMTPAMKAGVARRPWSVADLLTA